MPEVKWHLNNEVPPEEGHYIITVYTSMMYGSSYVWTTDVAYFDGEEWERPGVMAWAEFPFEPFMPKNEDERRIVFENQCKTKP